MLKKTKKHSLNVQFKKCISEAFGKFASCVMNNSNSPVQGNHPHMDVLTGLHLRRPIIAPARFQPSNPWVTVTATSTAGFGQPVFGASSSQRPKGGSVAGKGWTNLTNLTSSTRQYTQLPPYGAFCEH